MKTLKTLAWAVLLALPLPLAAADLEILVLADQIVGPISPYVYGLNTNGHEGTGATLRRLGGNRMSGYNWETNDSNAGRDWKHTSDNWMCGGHLKFQGCESHGSMLLQFVEQNREAGMESLITLQMAGFVAADRSGEVGEDEAAPSKRWKEVLFRKQGKLSETPNTKDNAVHMDELVYFLTRKLGTSDKGGVKFYNLDNEPALWSETHPRIHPKKAGYYELVNKTEALGANLLKIDPKAMLFGPVLYGWQAFLTLQEAPGFEKINEQFGSFVGFYLDQMKALEERHGKRILHALDLHWYPEAKGGGKRITEGDTSDGSVMARVQAPRSLWDPDYVEESWITQWSTKGKPIRLIPWMRENIEKYYPGTKMAFTEYDYGAGSHVSGGIAQADVLGLFGREGVFAACYWSDLKPYNRAAFRIFRDYDGKGSTYGDTALSAAVEDVSRASVYASKSTKDTGKLWILVLNKDLQEPSNTTVSVKNGGTFTKYKAYGFDGDSPDIQSLKDGVVKEGRFTVSLAPLSATLFVLE